MSTAFKKIEAIGREIGVNVGAQGSTQNIYQDLPRVAAQTNYRFFSTLNLSPGLRKNVTDNKFQSGQSLAVQAISFRVVIDGDVNPDLIDLAATANAISNMRFTLKIGNSEVISRAFFFNDNASGFPAKSGAANANYNFVFQLENFVVIPAQTDYEVTIQLVEALPATVVFIGCDLWGRGTYPESTY